MNKRVIGKYATGKQGPTTIFVGGLHGNETSGVTALRNVLEELHRSRIRFNGTMIALAGNLKALARGVRYIDTDLNRAWDARDVERRRNEPFAHNGPAEFGEQKELLEQLEKAFNETEKPAFVFDLHTTSSKSRPFINIADTLTNRNFAMKFPLPIVLGIEEHLECTLLNYINLLGHVAVGCEGGQHEAESSIDNHAAFVWKCLVHAGCINRNQLASYERCEQLLGLASNHITGFFEVRDRYVVSAKEDFVMESGFASFQRIRKGQLLAKNRLREIRSTTNSLILMPLYQNQGRDGFFIIREIRPFWVTVSAVLRKLRLDRLLHLLPGVRIHPSLAGTFVVNNRVARLFALELFHLLGFRRESRENGKLLVSKGRSFQKR